MAGVYPDPPGERMAYDLDGSVGFFVDSSNNVTQLTASQLAALNTEDPRGGLVLPNWGGSGFLGILFPQLRDLDHYMLANSNDKALNAWGIVSSTTDSATGVDGTWVSQGGLQVHRDIASTVAPPGGAFDYRSSINILTAGGLKGVRFSLNTVNNVTTIWAMHLYGVITSGQTPDRLRFWHPTTDQALSVTPALLDFGDVARGGTYTKTFRIKNNSSTLTANSPAVTITAPTDSTGTTQLSEMALSADGGTTWHAGSVADPLVLSNLAAGAISPVITMRRVKSLSSPLGAWAQRIRAAAASWS